MSPLLPRCQSGGTDRMVNNFVCRLCDQVAPARVRCSICNACASCCSGHEGELGLWAGQVGAWWERDDLDDMEDESEPYFWNRGN